MSEEYRQLLAAAVDIIAEEWGHAGELESGAQLSESPVSDFLERARAALAAEPPDGSDETMSWIGQAVARAIDEQMPEAVEPILLSERKPGPNEREYDGIDYCCWWAKQQDDRWSWKWGLWSGETHWLPASTKYLPARVE